MPRSATDRRRRGRTGRRTALTVQVARQRILDLFELARREANRGDSRLADRYVNLSRRIGTRYNVRIPAPLRASCCRACSTYWIEGRTVRTRLRFGWTVRTCLACGAIRRNRLRGRSPRSRTGGFPDRLVRPPAEPVFVEDETGFEDEAVEAGEGELE